MTTGHPPAQRPPAAPPPDGPRPAASPPFALLPVALTLALALIAGLGAEAIGTPLPWLLGPLAASAAVAMAGVRPFGVAPQMPRWTRPVFTPVIGVAIGCTVTPQVFDQAALWWPSLAAVTVFVLLVQLTNFAVLRRFGGFDRPTAYFAASPGGLIDAVLIGEQRGGDAAAMATMHLARIALAVAAVPLILTFVADETGVALAPAAAPGLPGLADAAILAASAVGGALLGVRLGLPAGVMLGPFLASAALHLAGVTTAQVPLLVLHLAQMAVGAVLGLRFAGLARRTLLKSLGLTLATTTIAIALAAGFALALDRLVPATAPAIFLAFSPGGVAEMGLVALSLGAEPAFVIVHHLVRIVFTVSAGPILYDRLIARRP